MAKDLALPKLQPQHKITTNVSAAETSAHSDIYPRIYCAEHFNMPDKRAEHIKQVHGISQSWLCHDCPDAFEDNQALRQHQRNHNNVQAKLRYCRRPGCEFKTSFTGRFERHEKDDHGNAFRCPDCSFENHSCVGISVHKLHWHSGQRSCKKCNRSFASPAEQLAHTAESARCDDCEALFCSKKQRDTHARFACPAAAKKRADASKLKVAPSPSQPPLAPGAYASGSPTREPMAAAHKLAGTTAHETASASHPSIPAPSAYTPATSDGNGSPPPMASQENNVRFAGVSALGLGGQTITLPSSVLAAGFSHGDFDPLRVYVSTKPDKLTYRDVPADIPDAVMFGADPKLLCKGNLLRLAERYTNSQLLWRINAGRPAAVLASSQSMSGRVQTALEWQASELGITVAEARASLAEKRKALTPSPSTSPSRKRGRDENDDAPTSAGASPEPADTPEPAAKRPRESEPAPMPNIDFTSSDKMYQDQLKLLEAMSEEDRAVATGLRKKRKPTKKAKVGATATPKSSAPATPAPQSPGSRAMSSTPSPAAETIDLTEEGDGDAA